MKKNNVQNKVFAIDDDKLIAINFMIINVDNSNFK